MGVRNVERRVTTNPVTVKGVLDAVKRRQALTRDHIRFFVRGVVDRSIPDYQAVAFLSFTRCNGLSDAETVMLTEEMARSGKMLDLSGVQGVTVDKHSTGGISDGTSFIIAPLLASYGLKIPMMSGRGLGQTGGTLDKLEAIAGFNVFLTQEQVVDQLNQVGLAIFSQTDEIVPADKILYGLRDVTETVDSLPLIAASIMSKKLAEGAGSLVMNVTTGSGAFMARLADAKKLAATMVDIAKAAGRNASSVISDMSQPLASFVGNALEIKQALRILAGEQKGFENFISVVVELSAHLLVHGGLYAWDQLGTARGDLRTRLASGAALPVFRQMVEAQGGNVRMIDDPSLLPTASRIIPVPSPSSGYVKRINATNIGLSAMYLGAGRESKESKLDLAVGLKVGTFVGDRVEEGQPLAWLHVNDDRQLSTAIDSLVGAYEFSNQPVKRPRLILGSVI